MRRNYFNALDKCAKCKEIISMRSKYAKNAKKLAQYTKNAQNAMKLFQCAQNMRQMAINCFDIRRKSVQCAKKCAKCEETISMRSKIAQNVKKSIQCAQNCAKCEEIDSMRSKNAPNAN